MGVEQLQLMISFLEFILGCGTLIIAIVLIIRFIIKISIHINAIDQIGQISGIYLYSNEDVKKLPLMIKARLESDIEIKHSGG